MSELCAALLASLPPPSISASSSSPGPSLAFAGHTSSTSSTLQGLRRNSSLPQPPLHTALIGTGSPYLEHTQHGAASAFAMSSAAVVFSIPHLRRAILDYHAASLVQQRTEKLLSIKRSVRSCFWDAIPYPWDESQLYITPLEYFNCEPQGDKGKCGSSCSCSHTTTIHRHAPRSH